MTPHDGRARHRHRGFAVEGGRSPAAREAGSPVEGVARGSTGGYLDEAKRVSRLTAPMHDGFASARGDPEAAPETFSTLYPRSLYQSMRCLTGNVMDAGPGTGDPPRTTLSELPGGEGDEEGK